MLKIGNRCFWLYFLAVSAWVLLYLLANNKTDWDLWGVMSFGALLEQNPGHFPRIDPFSYTTFRKPWVYHEWGSGLIFYQLVRHWGSASLFWLKLALAEAIFLVGCHHRFKRATPAEDNGAFRPLAFAALLTVGAYLLLPMLSITIRCQLFTFLFFGLALMVLERFREQSKSGDSSREIWLLPPLMLVWVNVHGGFITGFLAIGVYWLAALYERQAASFKTLTLLLALCGVAVLINPYGPAFFTTMAAAWTLPRTNILEWGNVLSLDVPAYGTLYSLLAVLSVLLALVRFQRQPHRFPYAALLLAATGVYGWMHYKLAPLFLVTLFSLGYKLLPQHTPFLPENWKPPTFGLKLWATFGLPLLLFCFGGILSGVYLQAHPNPFQVQTQGIDAVPKHQDITHYAYPLGLTRFLMANHIRGNLWAPFSWGEFLYWVLYPDCRVSIDGRYETVYPQSVDDDFQRFYYPPYDLAAAERYPTTHIIVDTGKAELIQKLSRSGRWHEIYRDAMAILYARQASHYPAQAYSNQSDTLDAYMGNPDRFRLSADFYR